MPSTLASKTLVPWLSSMENACQYRDQAPKTLGQWIVMASSQRIRAVFTICSSWIALNCVAISPLTGETAEIDDALDDAERGCADSGVVGLRSKASKDHHSVCRLRRFGWCFRHPLVRTAPCPVKDGREIKLVDNGRLVANSTRSYLVVTN
jgi:hypothetical protein